MRVPRRQFLHLAAGAVAAHAAPWTAWAQSYPERPVRMIVPYAPGGSTDIVTCLVAQQLTERVGKQFFVENIGGGGGNIGTGRAAKAAPDVYTTLVVNPSYVVNPTLYGKVPYEFEKDFDPVTLMVLTSLVLAVHPSVPAGTVEALVALMASCIAKSSTSSRCGRSRSLAVLGFEPVASTPAQFARQSRIEFDAWAKVIRSSGLKAQ
ncbi:MAG TPA: tripartite tricarboxylate transporter substrate-binding protein [Xanthobacteraceae bacterium]|jgi:tripartite-type tricarboxylate transporter receptor subunit TctC